MNKLLKELVICAAGIIMGAGSLVYSQDNQTDSSVQEPEKKWMYGSVAQVAFAQGFIKLFNDQGYKTIEITDKTTVTLKGKKSGLDELHTEDAVRVQYYSPEPGRLVAVSINKS